MNKRGWITILEATIAVMLVSGVLVVVYTKQDADEVSIGDYVFSLQKQVLSDISARGDLRTLALEKNEVALNVFVGSKVPTAYSYSLKVCSLRDNTYYCILDVEEVRATREKDLFAEEIVVSADLGNGTAPLYEPMKVRLFVWENR